MRYFLLYSFTLSILLICNSVAGRDYSNNGADKSNENTLIITTTPELRDLTADWISSYEKLNPGVLFSLKTLNESDSVTSGTGIFISTDDITNSFNWKICIGYNVLVPVVNAKNPMIKEISAQGFSASDFALLYSGSGIVRWSDLINNGQNIPVNGYMIDNAGIKKAVSDFIHKDPAGLKARLIVKTSDFTAAVQEDPYAVGFCRLSDIINDGPVGLVANIRFLPVDKNGNGRMDHFESIFNTPADLSRGAWVGKYPHALSGSIYAMSLSAPADKNSIAFLSWIMQDGSKNLSSKGYGNLIGLEKQANLTLLAASNENEVTKSSKGSLPWMLILAVAIITVLTAIVITRLFTTSGSMAREDVPCSLPAMNEISVSSPEGLYYDKTHTWAFMERDGAVRLGIDDFLQHVTGTITRITMKNEGEYVRRGEKILTLIKFGKQLNLYSPVSGTIKSRNLKLDENSSLVNTSPFADGWVYLIEPKNWARELQFMWMGEKYRDWLKEEFIRLRTFFEGALSQPEANLEYSLLQDGGELRDNLLADQGPEVWEEFQRKFIDTSR